MAKQKSQELGKGPIGRCRYQILFDGRKATINVWGYGLHTQEAYRGKGLSWTQYDNGEVGNIIRRLVKRMERIAWAVNQWQKSEFTTITPRKDKKMKMPLSKIQV